MKKNNTLKGRPERATAGKVSIATEHAGGVGGGVPQTPAPRAEIAAMLLKLGCWPARSARTRAAGDMPVLRRYRKLCTAFWN